MASNALIKLTEERIDSNDKLQTFVERAKSVSIPLFPETVQFTDTSLKYGVALITVDSRDAAQVYKNESGSLSLHLKKIKEIADAAGVVWTDTKIEERKFDEQGRVVYSRVKVWGEMKSVDGTIKKSVAAGTYDYFMDCEKFSSEKQIKQRRFKADQLAESNAKFRCLQDLLVKLPNSFSAQELEKPFVVPYLIEDKNELLKDLPPEVQNKIKEEQARKRLGLSNEIYGAPVAEAKPKLNPTPLEEANYTVENDELPAALTNEPTPEEQAKIEAETFREVPQAARTSKILELVKETGYTDPNNAAITKNRIEKQSVDNQVKFIEKLLNLMNEEAPL